MKKLLLTHCSCPDGSRSVPIHFWRRAGLLSILFLILLGPLNAQQAGGGGRTPFKGKITNDKGEPLAGASVRQKNSTKGITTDATGAFTISAKPGDMIVITYVGYAEVRHVVAGGEEITIAMKPIAGTNMNDVIVIGYGTQKKANVLGAVSVVKAEDLVVTKNENVVNMLSGKVPGLRIQQMSSEPGSFNTQFDIRGFGSSSTGNPTPPLIIIDGVPRSSGDLARMDPSEIDNVSVLKDASAAIYGVKAANGVILVTTKRGGRNANGKFNVTYSVNQSWQQFLDVPNPVSAVQYM